MELARPRLYAVKSAAVENALKTLDRGGTIPTIGQRKAPKPRLSAKIRRLIRNSRPTVRKTKPVLTETKRRARRKTERQSRRANR